MLNHGGITVKDSSVHYLLKPQYTRPLFISEIASIYNEMEKYTLPIPNAMSNFMCFYREVLTKVNDGPKKLCWLHTMVQYFPLFVLKIENNTLLFQTLVYVSAWPLEICKGSPHKYPYSLKL